MAREIKRRAFLHLAAGVLAGGLVAATVRSTVPASAAGHVKKGMHLSLGFNPVRVRELAPDYITTDQDLMWEIQEGRQHEQIAACGSEYVHRVLYEIYPATVKVLNRVPNWKGRILLQNEGDLFGSTPKQMARQIAWNSDNLRNNSIHPVHLAVQPCSQYGWPHYWRETWQELDAYPYEVKEGLNSLGMHLYPQAGYSPEFAPKVAGLGWLDPVVVRKYVRDGRAWTNQNAPWMSVSLGETGWNRTTVTRLEAALWLNQVYAVLSEFPWFDHFMWFIANPGDKGEWTEYMPLYDYDSLNKVGRAFAAL